MKEIYLLMKNSQQLKEQQKNERDSFIDKKNQQMKEKFIKN
jgi:hypothetical protein